MMPIGDYDKRITLLTKERGKITAFARGARRPVSQLLAATSPFSFGEFELFEGHSTYNLARASISNYFRELSEDPEKACYGFYFLEIADYCSRENNDGSELLKLLYQTLRALGRHALENRLVRRIFELRVLLVEGEYPNLYFCQNCGKKERLSYFSVQKEGMLCALCKEGADGIPVEESALYTMQYILSAKLNALYTFAVSQEVLLTLEQILDRFFTMRISHAFQSLDILKSITG